MRLHRLDITAFGPFGGAQSVDFDDLSAAGLFLLHGPTGSRQDLGPGRRLLRAVRLGAGRPAERPGHDPAQ